MRSPLDYKRMLMRGAAVLMVGLFVVLGTVVVASVVGLWRLLS